MSGAGRQPETLDLDSLLTNTADGVYRLLIMSA